MPLRDPAWWYGSQQSVMVPLLRPLAKLYGYVAERRFRRSESYRSSLAVICVGNFTAGGTGKTPLAIHIARELKAAGQRPAFLTRGYGGRIRGPEWVLSNRHSAADVGDESLLLAAHAPTLVSADRKAGARAIEAEGSASAIIMDDGLQNPSLSKDLTIAVIDASRGVGNGEVIPAGPLRAPLEFQLALVDAVVINGAAPAHSPGPPSIELRLKQEFPGPVLEVRPQAKGDSTHIQGKRFIAYAGIGNPQRFFALLAELGAEIAETVTFPDHHAFSEADAERLLNLSAARNAGLITTEKDLMRLNRATGWRQELCRQSRTLAIELRFEEREALRFASLLTAALKRATE